MMRNEIGALYARTNTHRRRVASATEIVDRALQTADNPYVAVSGGKDATVVMALVRRMAPDIPCWWSDDEWYLPETEEYFERLAADGVNLHHVRTTTRHAEWFVSHEGLENNDNTYTRDRGWNLVFLGLRQEESSARRVYLRTYGPLHQPKDGVWRCNPVHDWTWQDVWGYIVSNGLDYNKAYDRMEEIGVSPEHQRVGPLAVERVLGRGQLAILKRGWPELYNRFVARYPEAALYV